MHKFFCGAGLITITISAFNAGTVMKRAGKMWIRDDDTFMGPIFEETGDKFEIDHLNAALEFVHRKRTAIDIGAHYGSWSRYLSREFRRVYSFEPMPETIACCEKNLAGFRNVVLERAAVGDRTGSVSVGVGKMYSHPGMETIVSFEGDTKMVSIDSLNLSNVDFIKIDVEGFELGVLKGARNTLLRDKPVVLFEENVRGPLEHNIENGECGKFLVSLGATKLAVRNKDFIYGWKSEEKEASSEMQDKPWWKRLLAKISLDR